MTWLQLLVNVLTPLVSIVGAVVAARYSMRATTSAATTQAGTDADRTAVESWKALLAQQEQSFQARERQWVQDRTDLTDRLQRAETKMDQAFGKIADLERREDQQHELLMEHAAWDYRILEVVRAGAPPNPHVPDPPPLWLPRPPT